MAIKVLNALLSLQCLLIFSSKCADNEQHGKTFYPLDYAAARLLHDSEMYDYRKNTSLSLLALLPWDTSLQVPEKTDSETKPKSEE